MAWIRAMGEPAPARKKIYTEGVFNETPISVASTYNAGGTNFNALYSAGANKFTLPSAAGKGSIYGTQNLVDVTNFSTLHFRAKGLTLAGGSSYYTLLGIGSSRDVNTSTNERLTSNTETEVTIDVSGMSGGRYIFAWTNASGNSSEIYEIWLD